MNNAVKTVGEANLIPSLNSDGKSLKEEWGFPIVVSYKRNFSAEIHYKIVRLFIQYTGSSDTTAISMKMWNWQRLAYLAVFDIRALSAAAPAFEDVSLTCEVAKLSGKFTSHVKHFPLDPGMSFQVLVGGGGK